MLSETLFDLSNKHEVDWYNKLMEYSDQNAQEMHGVYGFDIEGWKQLSKDLCMPFDTF